ncbi:50S ribosomal protein L10 [filamentous cyanobacterium LEGE 11480]|uniref:Large ribosomal subunit protein uL10 n=1 Tax=Romeriopsis navalis LEGE 11480 TaxID=2777977 RepID=A0A928VT47_9CYAN|nr:50S ribosomal protein L10 [Romeriopsis navalis]MBE9033233.1 50S ribosomal protein L10 [Romeriopsis navalis LEGE 11480]
MGRTLANKKAIVAGLKETLSDSSLAVVINYRGLTVAEISDLRNRLRPSGASCTVTKNTFMGKAIEGDDKWSPIEGLLKDTTAFILAKDDVGAAVKAYQAFQKETKKSEVLGGVMEGKLLSQNDIKAIADLPSKDELYAQIAGATNNIVANIAILVNEIPTGVARAVQAVADKDAA